MLLPTLRTLLVLVIVSAGGGLAYLGVQVATGHGAALHALLFWIGNQIGFATIAALLLATVVRRPAR